MKAFQLLGPNSKLNKSSPTIHFWVIIIIVFVHTLEIDRNKNIMILTQAAAAGKWWMWVDFQSNVSGFPMEIFQWSKLEKVSELKNCSSDGLGWVGWVAKHWSHGRRAAFFRLHLSSILYSTWLMSDTNRAHPHQYYPNTPLVTHSDLPNGAARVNGEMVRGHA